jgi:hypothetical protein
MTAIAIHPTADDVVQDPIATQTPIMSAPVINNDNLNDQQPPTMPEPTIQEPAPVVADTIQHIYTMYDAINNGNYSPADYFDSYMQTSDLVKMYFTTKRLTTLRAAIDGDIRINNAEEFATDRRDRIGVRYELSYNLANNSQTFAETRAVTLRPQT